MFTRRARLALVSLVALLLLGAGVAVAGGDVSDKFRTGDTVTIGADETVDHDLYAFADAVYLTPDGWQGAVVIDGTLEGDLIAAGGVVTINGSVDGDVLAAAGLVEVNGEVTGDVRALAGDVIVTGTIGEDLLAASGSINIRNGGEIGEDLIFSAGSVRMDGSVEGSILGDAGEYVRNGTVGGSENVTQTGRDPSEPDEPETPVEEATAVFGDAVRQWVSVILIGGLALLLVPQALRSSESALRRRPLASAGMGIGVLVGYLIGFIALILLMILAAIAFASITLDGLAALVVWGGVITLIVSTFLLVVAAWCLVDAVVGFALGRLVTRDWAQTRWHEFALLIVGSFVVILLTSLPGVGPIAKLVVIVLGLGSMAVVVGEWWSRRHPPRAVAFPAAPPAGAAALPPPPAPPPPPPASAEPAPTQPPPAAPKPARARKPRAPKAEPPADSTA